MKGPMTPLQWIALGLVIVFLQAGPEYDVYANPLGWAFVVVGTTRLPVERQRLLLGLAWLALLVATPLWFPDIREPLYDADDSLAWATELPQFGFVILLCRQLMAAARPVDQRGFVRFATLSVLFTALVLVPPFAIAGDIEWLAEGGSVVLLASQIWLVWSLFSHHSRPYAKPPAATQATGGSGV